MTPAAAALSEVYLADDDVPDDSIHTIAAHHDGEDWTEEELDEIETFKKFVLSKRDEK